MGLMVRMVGKGCTSIRISLYAHKHVLERSAMTEYKRLDSGDALAGKFRTLSCVGTQY